MRQEAATLRVDDLDVVAHQWGVGVAMQMLSEKLISPGDFLVLCAEAASAGDHQAIPCHRTSRKRSCGTRRSGRRATDIATVAV